MTLNSSERFTLNAYGFDSIQQIGIKESLRGNGISAEISFLYQESMKRPHENFPEVDANIYLLTPRNFATVVRHIKAQPRLESESTLFIVTDVPSLSLLGIEQKSLPSKTIYLSLAEFGDLLRGSGEQLFRSGETKQARPIERFFETAKLSRSQVRLLLLIAHGDTNAEIAREMVLTEKGVESAIKRLAIKLERVRTGEKPQNLRILLGRRYAQLLGVL